MAKARKPIDHLRRIVSAWPEIDERISHGSPTFWGGKKTFASFHENHHGDGRIARILVEIFFVAVFSGVLLAVRPLRLPSGFAGRLERPDYVFYLLLACAISTKYTHRRAMRTNIVIDDKLMADALKATGLNTKKEGVEQGLRLLCANFTYFYST